MKKGGLGFFLSMCYAAAVFGADANKTTGDTQLGTVSVTAANFSETLVDDVSKPMSVVTKEEIQAKAPTSVVEAMKDAPGVSFSRAGGLGGQLVMRGFNSNDLKIPMAINGERFRGRNTLEYNIIDPSMVEQIEIIRGPAAAIYGSEAMAGMINIVTKKPTPNFSDTITFKPILKNISYESVNNMFASRAEVEGGGKGVDMLLGLSGKSADDYDTPNGTAKNSSFDSKQVDGTVGYSFDSKNRIELNFKFSETHTNRAGGLGGAPGMDAPMTQRVNMREDPILERYVGIAYSGKPEKAYIDKIDASMYARTLWTDVVSTTYNASGAATEAHRYVVGPLMYGGKAIAVSSFKDTILTGGVDFYLQDWKGAESEKKGATVTSRTKIEADSTQNNFGAFLLAEHDLTSWLAISANARYDYYKTENDADVVTIPALASKIQENKSKTDNVTTYAAGAIVKPISWLNFAANYATTYRVPSVNELFGYGPYGSGYNLPNPELNPEKGNTVDLSARLRFENLNANLTVYQSKYTDLLATQNVTYLGQPSTQKINIGKATVEGIEFDAAYRLTKAVTLKANCAYTKGTDTTTVDKPLKYIAPFVANFGVKYDNKAYYIEADGRYSRKKDRIDATQEREAGSYTVFDIYAGVELGQFSSALSKSTLRLGIENIFDREYRDATTQEKISSPISDSNPLIEPGRNFKFALTSRF